MIYTTNILAAPLILLVWCIDAYMFLAAIRFVISRLHVTQTSGVCSALEKFTDPIPNNLRRWLSARRARPVPNWLAWLLVISGGIVLRTVFLWIVIKAF